MVRKLKSVLQGDVPAKETLIKLKEQEDKICKLKEKDQDFALKTQGMGDKLDTIGEKVDDLTKKLDGFINASEANNEAKFVSKAEFSPVQKIVYGAVSIILAMFIAGAVASAAYFIIRD